MSAATILDGDRGIEYRSARAPTTAGRTAKGNGTSAVTSPIYSYPHNGRDAVDHRRFRLSRHAVPEHYQGSYFFADYTQNWIKRLTFDANGNVTGVFNFEPADGSVDGPYGDIVYLTEGPDGALYYVDLGYSDIGGTFGVSKIRRISYVAVEPAADRGGVGATRPSGPAPLTVELLQRRLVRSRRAAADLLLDLRRRQRPRPRQPDAHLRAARPVHGAAHGLRRREHHALDAAHDQRRQPRRRRRSCRRTDGSFFRRGRRDLLQRRRAPTSKTARCPPAPSPGTSTSCTKATCIRAPHDRREERHVHDPDHRARLQRQHPLPHHADGHRLQRPDEPSRSPSSRTKVNLTFDTAPAGLTLYLDGIAQTAPFVYDTLIGFNHTIEARNQTVGGTTYNFASWSDGGAQQHTIIVPEHRRRPTRRRTRSRHSDRRLPSCRSNGATPQTNQSSVSVSLHQCADRRKPQHPRDRLERRRPRNITSVTDSRRQRLPARGAEPPRQRPSARRSTTPTTSPPGQHGDSHLQRLDAVRRRADRRVHRHRPATRSTAAPRRTRSGTTDQLAQAR